jgi:hypothetical protein
MVLLGGCAGWNQAPPTPFEVKILASTAMAVGIHSQKMTDPQLEKLVVVLRDARGVIQLAIAEDPNTVEPITLGIADKLDPVYAASVKGMLQLLIVRIRPMIQEGGDLKLAGEYVDAVFGGAIQACGEALGAKAAA